MNGVKVPEHIDVSKLAQAQIRKTLSIKLDDVIFYDTWENFKDSE